ncbi:MAG: hypothetical protein R3D67_18035 [Hyphomicrobiaceae bacterium]
MAAVVHEWLRSISQRLFNRNRSFNAPRARSGSFNSGPRGSGAGRSSRRSGGNAGRNCRARRSSPSGRAPHRRNVADNQQRRSFRTIQPPAPGGNVAGNQQPRSFRTVQPPAPGGRIGSGSSFIPTAAAATAVGAGAIAATRPAAAGQASATNAAPVNETKTVEATPVADKQVTDTPPAEMLARIGTPIEPLAKAPSTASSVTATVARTPVIVKRVAEAEQCNTPRYRYRSWRRYHHRANATGRFGPDKGGQACRLWHGDARCKVHIRPKFSTS